jgi:hypothetical protein
LLLRNLIWFLSEFVTVINLIQLQLSSFFVSLRMTACTQGAGLASFFKQGHKEVALLDHLCRNFKFFHLLAAGQVIHQVKH